MGYSEKKKPLYRTVNTRSHSVNYYRGIGPDSKNDRNTKNGLKKSMKSRKLGLDFRPLFMFLLSKVGEKWDDIYSEAKSRLPESEGHVIQWIFGSGDTVRIGDNAYFSSLIVDENGILQKKSNIGVESVYPSCDCCTHTFNGKTLTNKWADNPAIIKLL